MTHPSELADLIERLAEGKHRVSGHWNVMESTFENCQLDDCATARAAVASLRAEPSVEPAVLTPNDAALIERLITRWHNPHIRAGAIRIANNIRLLSKGLGVMPSGRNMRSVPSTNTEVLPATSAPSVSAPGGAEHCPGCDGRLKRCPKDCRLGIQPHEHPPCPGLRQRGPSREALMEVEAAAKKMMADTIAGDGLRLPITLSSIEAMSMALARCAREEAAHD